MKKIKYTTTLFLFLFSLTFVKAEGIQFFKGNFAEAIEKAKAENKLVFIDFYTTWCGPCKKMDKDIFPKEEVGAYFNQHFVSLKIDAEKGEGIQLADKYKVRGYPTMLFINTDETEKDRIVGATPNAEFLVNYAKMAMGEGSSFLSLFKEYEEKGNRDFDYIRTLLTKGPVYAQSLKDQEKQRKWYNRFFEISKWYFAAKPPRELLNAEDFKLIAQYLDGPNNRHPVVEFLYNHYEDYKKIVPVEELTMFVQRTNNQSIHEASGEGDLAFREYVEAINGRLKQAHIDGGKESEDTYKIMKYVAEASYAKSQDDIDGYLDWSDKYKVLQKETGKLSAMSYGATIGNALYSHKDKITEKQAARMLQLVQEGLKLDAKNTMLLENQGDLYAIQNKKSEAIGCYRKVIEYSKGKRGEHYFKGKMLDKIGTIDPAVLSVAERGAKHFPELEFTHIKGAPQLSKPFLVMGEDPRMGETPIVAEKHGLIAPALWDWNGDGKRDLLVGEFETTSAETGAVGEKGSTIKVYLNQGTDEVPKFNNNFFYAKDNTGVPMEVKQWCCIGFTPMFVDLDNDGYQDIITGQYHPGDVTWFRGTGKAGAFKPGIKLEQEGNPASNGQKFRDPKMTDDHIESFGYWNYSAASFGDFDDDGDLDLIVGGSAIRISENIGTKEKPKFARRKLLLDVNGNPLMTKTISEEEKKMFAQSGSELPKAGSSKTQQFVVDWDNDGVLDILSTDDYRSKNSMAVAFFKGVKTKGGHRFQPAVDLIKAKDGSKALPGSGNRVYVDDWNKDGMLDLIVGASIVTVDGQFHSKMSWEYEDDLGIPSAGKDYGRVPEQFEIPSFEDFKKQEWFARFAKEKSEAEQKAFYETQMAFKKEGLKKLKDKGVPEATRMLHRGYIYVFLGKKPGA